MHRGLLSDYFEGVAVKRLSAVEAEWSLLCTAHNLLKLHQATGGA